MPPAKLPYVHVEYPKWVGDKIVYSEDEELALLEEIQAEAAPKSDDKVPLKLPDKGATTKRR